MIKFKGVWWEHLRYNRYQPRLSQFRHHIHFTKIPHFLFNKLAAYLLSLENPWILGLFNCVAVALFSHKIMKIDLHGPLPIWRLIVFLPALFALDVLTLAILHLDLKSSRVLLKISAAIGTVALILLSSVFASLYLVGNAELNWSRSVEVLIPLCKALMAGPCRLEVFQEVDGSRE